ncbi:F-type H+-transporting ATPase subunit delta [Dehalogenimonas formicexedens]|uniref:ATP synthase subunit delta n=1 Tax=Dehalogenimonas formicexedens TaxID=1839801 RepID=A0A1P8F6W4_9CHLR|nr:F0F1 ATP synthase subunit delta [Dehalogenimonas formicexedens]APV44219.1 F-type H+-transporting ATPase subunit delta [Dehalogenimonas formicexedens]
MGKSAYAQAMRYGQAIFEIAAKHQNFNTWRDNLETLVRMVQDRDVLFFLENPRVSVAAKREALEPKLKGVNPLAVNLLYLLVERGGLALMPDIFTDYQRRLDELHGIAHANVSAAVPLSEAETVEIKQKLSLMFGKQVDITTKVNPSLLGGIVARVGDKVIDGSVSRRLENLKREINQARL